MWDVIIIGGGCTGVGILRDLSMRGVKCLLLEQRDLAHGTSSRFHGLLHSGARYAVSDPQAAQECIAENAILRRIGTHCVEPNTGLFIRTCHDDPSYEETWLAACAACGIEVQPLAISDLLKQEPELSPHILSAYTVPDAGVDGFRLVWQNALSAQRHGGTFQTYAQVTKVQHANGIVTGVHAQNMHTNESDFLPCRLLINATGSWVDSIAGMAGTSMPVQPDKGTLIAFNHRVTERIINRLRTPSDGDIFVPHGSITIFGTTSGPAKTADDTSPSMQHVQRLLELGRSVMPRIDSFRILRAFAGTRPLYAASNETLGRGASRHHMVIDHEHEGLSGMISVCGGKLTTYRRMAESVSDLACLKLGHNAVCTSADEPLVLPPSKNTMARAATVFPAQGMELALSRLGDAFEGAVERAEAEPHKKALLCECEMVTVAEFEQVASEPTTHNLNDIRRRTRMGMGTCQGTFCGVRAAALAAEIDATMPAFGAEQLRTFQDERWAGFRPVLWGLELREVELARNIYGATLNIDGDRYDKPQ